MELDNYWAIASYATDRLVVKVIQVSCLFVCFSTAHEHMKAITVRNTVLSIINSKLI